MKHIPFRAATTARRRADAPVRRPVLGIAHFDERPQTPLKRDHIEVIRGCAQPGR